MSLFWLNSFWQPSAGQGCGFSFRCVRIWTCLLACWANRLLQPITRASPGLFTGMDPHVYGQIGDSAQPFATGGDRTVAASPGTVGSAVSGLGCRPLRPVPQPPAPPGGCGRQQKALVRPDKGVLRGCCGQEGSTWYRCRIKAIGESSRCRTTAPLSVRCRPDGGVRCCVCEAVWPYHQKSSLSRSLWDSTLRTRGEPVCWYGAGSTGRSAVKGR